MATSSRERVRKHRERQRAQHQRPIQKWVSDLTSPELRREVGRQSALLAAEAEVELAQTAVLGEPEPPSLADRAAESRQPRVRRGEVWTATGGVYARKPRPVVVVQDDAFQGIGSVTVCPMTTREVAAPMVRIAVDPTAENGLQERSYIMVDKITTTGRAKVHTRLGALSREHLTNLERALLEFLGFAR
jgi:mRNA interferase MazF